MTNKYLCRIISRFTLIINDKVGAYFLWLQLSIKKCHTLADEIQNTYYYLTMISTLLLFVRSFVRSFINDIIK